MNIPTIRALGALLSVSLAAGGAIWGQAAGQSGNAVRPSFEVASVKLVKGEVTFSSGPFTRGRMVRATALTLRDLIAGAYEIRYDQISGGPSWADSDHYDIDAKAADGEGGPLTEAQSRQMIQSLLADRFQLRVHRETQEAPVYELVAGKSGPKMKPVAADAPGDSYVMGSAKGLHMERSHGTMRDLADQLSFTAGRPVIDKTGLAGTYAYKLDWYPANSVPPPDLDTPSMFTALQEQLGLRLESAKGPVEKLVIDHAERPSEN